MAKAFFIAAVIASFIFAPSCEAQNISLTAMPMGEYHKVKSITREFVMDTALKDTNYSGFDVSISLSSMSMNASSLDYCMEGSHLEIDVNITDVKGCTKARYTPQYLIRTYHGINIGPIRGDGDLGDAYLSTLGGKDTVVMHFETQEDTVNLSFYWIELPGTGNVFLPGDWTPAEVSRVCSKLMDANPLCANQTLTDRVWCQKNLKVLRYETDWVAGPGTAINPAANPTANRFVPFPIDALGRKAGKEAVVERGGDYLWFNAREFRPSE